MKDYIACCARWLCLLGLCHRQRRRVFLHVGVGVSSGRGCHSSVLAVTIGPKQFTVPNEACSADLENYKPGSQLGSPDISLPPDRECLLYSVWGA